MTTENRKPQQDWRTARQIALDLAAELGAEIKEMPAGISGVDITVTAPYRQLWAATDTHEVVGHVLTHAAAAWQDVAADMRYGLEECTEVDCEFCLDTCMVCDACTDTEDWAAHWAAPFSADLIGLTCSTEHEDLIDAARDADDRLTLEAVRKVRKAFRQGREVAV